MAQYQSWQNRAKVEENRFGSMAFVAAYVNKLDFAQTKPAPYFNRQF